MLDYAANATAFWKVELLRAWFDAECERRGSDSAPALEAAFGVTDPSTYWARVQTNLAADRIRLVFVADEIAPELRSIVEFLNRQMSETEVLAIEVKQYVDADGERQTIVPRVVGRTEAARAAKGVVGRSETSAFDLSTAPPDFRELLVKMDSIARDLGLSVTSGRTGRNYRPPVLEPGARNTSGIGVYATGHRAEFNLAVFRELGADDIADDCFNVFAASQVSESTHRCGPQCRAKRSRAIGTGPAQRSSSRTFKRVTSCQEPHRTNAGHVLNWPLSAHARRRRS